MERTGSTIPSPQTVHNCCYHVSQHSQQHFSRETGCTWVSLPPSPGLKAALAVATSPSLSISHEQPPKPPHSHHRLGLQLPTRHLLVLLEMPCIHQAPPGTCTAIWKAQRCHAANVLGRRCQLVLAAPQRMRGRPKEEKPGRLKEKKKKRELGACNWEIPPERPWVPSYFKKGDSATATSAALKVGEEGLILLLLPLPPLCSRRCHQC